MTAEEWAERVEREAAYLPPEARAAWREKVADAVSHAVADATAELEARLRRLALALSRLAEAAESWEGGAPEAAEFADWVEEFAREALEEGER